MKEKKQKKENQAAEKVIIRADKIVAVYRTLSTPTNPRINQEGFRLSALETKDIFVVLRAMNAMKPVEEAYTAFENDARERLKPENFAEIAEKFNNRDNLSGKERAEVEAAVNEYTRKVNECIVPELEKMREIDAYEHLSEEAFGTLVKSNGHLLTNIPDVMLLQEVIA